MDTHQETPTPSNRNQPRGRRSRWSGFTFTIAIGILVAWGLSDTGIDPDRLAASGPRVWSFLDRMFPPDWSVLPTVIDASVETFHIALLGTVMSVAFSIVLGALAAETVT